VTRGLRWGDLVDRLQSFSFHHLRYPNYGALTFTPAGLSPAEHASLRWTHNHTHTFPLTDLATALRYARERINDAVKVVVKAGLVEQSRIAAQ
jgi:DNA-binding MarR family transcriptional regulator